MPANYVLLEKITVGAAGAASVTFANIPQTGYTDLSLVVSARSSLAQIYGGGNMIFNDDTTVGNYAGTIRLYGTGSSTESGTYNTYNIDGTNYNGNSATANTFGSRSIYIPNYTGSQQKSVSIDETTENNASTAYMGIFAGLWKSSSAINKITFRNNGSETFIANSTFYLYGVAKLNTTPAISPKATGGDIIQTDGTYWYHAFLSSGTFTPAAGLSCDYLVVAGGGGSGDSSNGAGGGAGGLRSTVTATGGGGSLETAKSFASGTAYTITIGGGGASQANGSNSSIAGSGLTTITSTGGGYGGNGGAGSSGATGGSGGGVYNFPTYSAGAGTANQGFAGGNGVPSPSAYMAGGGGGAGEAGNTDGTGHGGDGVQITAFATPTGTGADSGYYAGGGGGAADAGTFAPGGLGGGGRGGVPQATGSTSGTANTGGGGGGYPKSGGSGIVIVRYAV
jgi:hypothetical protein